MARPGIVLNAPPVPKPVVVPPDVAQRIEAGFRWLDDVLTQHASAERARRSTMVSLRELIAAEMTRLRALKVVR